jgi:glyoxylase-like metal-dependent hydrolase (beta-lactamase superfamily II)
MDNSVFRDGMNLPKEFQPAPGLDGVYYLGAVHGKGWIARSYFVERKAGNILVSPLVYSEGLGDFIEAHGGLSYIFVTHQDEINAAVLSEVGREGPGKPPDRIPACEYKKRFGCQIATHTRDTLELDECEVDLRWDADISPEPGLQFIHTPGHTPGSACLLLDTPAGRLLFCGDIVGINDSGIIDTEVEEGEIPHLPSTLDSWSKVVERHFDALIPLHTFADSPVPFITQGGREALKQALAEATSWWDRTKYSQ